MKKNPCVLDAARVLWFGVTLVYSESQDRNKKSEKRKEYRTGKNVLLLANNVHVITYLAGHTILSATVLSSDRNEACSEI